MAGEDEFVRCVAIRGYGLDLEFVGKVGVEVELKFKHYGSFIINPFIVWFKPHKMGYDIDDLATVYEKAREVERIRQYCMYAIEVLEVDAV